MSSRSALTVLIAVIVTACTLYLLSMNCVSVGDINDDAMYIIASRSFTVGQGMRETFDPAAPKTRFPPGLPLLIALPVLSFWPDFWLLKLAALIFALSSIYVLYLYFSRRSDSFNGLAIAMLFALNPVTVLYSGTVMADFPYLLCSFLTLFLLEEQKSVSSKTERWSMILLACLAFFSLWLRLIGVSLIIAVTIVLLLKRRYLHASLCAAAGALAYAGIIFFSDTTCYAVTKQSMNVSKIIEIVIQNLQFYMTNNFFIVPQISEPYNTPVLVVLVTLLVLALVINWRKGTMGVLELYLLGYSFLLLTYPYFSSRLIIPVLPILLYFIFISLREIAGQRRERLAFIAVSLLMIIPYAIHDASIIETSLKKGFRESTYVQPHQWMKEHIPAEALIMSDHSPSLYLYTGLKGTVFTGERASYNQLRHIYFNSISYIFFNPDRVGASRISRVKSHSQAHLLTVQENTRDFERVYEDKKSGVVIYKVIGNRTSYLDAYQYLMSAYVFSQKGAQEEALSEISRCLEKRPHFLEALNLKGSIMLEKGDKEGAIATFRELLTFSGNFAQGHYNLGRAYKEEDRLDDARREFEAAFACARSKDDIELMEGALEMLRELEQQRSARQQK
ncbi:MAG: hypothetical protein AB9903_26250 [Vulcanimicrobiota bacterium]